VKTIEGAKRARCARPFFALFLSGYVAEFAVLYAHRKKRPATRPLLALHASLELSPECKRPTLTAGSNVEAALASP